MTDHELLERAAKAAGIEGIYYDKQEMIRPFVFERRFGVITRGGEWNPLEDDGDAMRLAVACGIEFYIEGEGDDEMVWANAVSLYTDGNKNSIARRAITLAAASLGEEFYEQ